MCERLDRLNDLTPRRTTIALMKYRGELLSACLQPDDHQKFCKLRLHGLQMILICFKSSDPDNATHLQELAAVQNLGFFCNIHHDAYEDTCSDMHAGTLLPSATCLSQAIVDLLCA